MPRTKRRKRSRRGGLKPSNIKACNNAGISWNNCEEWISKQSNNTTTSSGCSDDDNFVRPGASGPLCKTLRSRQAKTRAETDQNKKEQMQDVVNSMCNKLAGKHCKKSCGECPKKSTSPPPPPTKNAFANVVKAAQNATLVKKKCRDLSISECGSNSECKPHRFKSKGKGRSKLTCVNKSKITGGKRHRRTKRRRKKRTKKKARKKRRRTRKR